jgi:hypothetical protein
MRRSDFEDLIISEVEMAILDDPSLIGLDDDLDIIITEINVDTENELTCYIENDQLYTDVEVTVRYTYTDEDGEEHEEEKGLSVQVLLDPTYIMIDFSDLNKNDVHIRDITY